MDCIKILIQKKVNVNQIDASGRTALHLAAWFDHSETAELLLQNGADISLADYQGHTALHLACWFGQVKTCGVLINHGAPLNATDQTLRTPLHFACQHNRVEIVKILLQAGASTTIKNTNGKTAEQIAIQEERLDIIEILQEANKDKSTPTSGTGKTPEIEYLDEHNRMKTGITKLIESRDSQVEQINAMQTRIEKQGSALASLATSQEELQRSLDSLHDILLGIWHSVQNMPSHQLPQRQSIPPAQVSPVLPTAGMPAQSQRINIQRGPPVCCWCHRNPATKRCTHCQQPFCDDCVEHATANGCPICHQ